MALLSANAEEACEAPAADSSDEFAEANPFDYDARLRDVDSALRERGLVPEDLDRVLAEAELGRAAQSLGVSADEIPALGEFVTKVVGSRGDTRERVRLLDVLETLELDAALVTDVVREAARLVGGEGLAAITALARAHRDLGRALRDLKQREALARDRLARLHREAECEADRIERLTGLLWRAAHDRVLGPLLAEANDAVLAEILAVAEERVIERGTTKDLTVG